MPASLNPIFAFDLSRNGESCWRQRVIHMKNPQVGWRMLWATLISPVSQASSRQL